MSAATTVNAIGASESGVCTEPSTMNVYVRTGPLPLGTPGMLDSPAILSTADAIPGPPVSSTTAVTITGSERFDHVVGAVTDVIRGPCSSHAAFTHASAAAQTVVQGYSQRWSWLQVTPASSPPSGRVQSAVTLHVPSDGPLL